MEESLSKKVKKARLKVKPELCLGCGICTLVCHQRAISLVWRKAWIDTRRCDFCGECIKVCPANAIRGEIPISSEELKERVKGLRQQVDDILGKLEKLRS